MTPPLPPTLRDLRPPGDYAPVAALRNAAQPGWPTSAAELARQDAVRDPALFCTRIVAEHGGQLVGVGSARHDDFSHEEWRYWGDLSVHPEARRRGVGRALYGELLRRVRGRGARELRTMLSSRPGDAPGRAFLEARGWAVAWERYESELDTAQADLGAFGALLDGVAASGVRLVSLADLAADPERDARLHELDWELFQDVPSGTALTKKTLEQWVEEELRDPNLRPELSFVAVRDDVADPLTGPYIGYSTLGQSAAGFHFIGMTGVRRGFRGQGVAKALKVAAMRALRAQTRGRGDSGDAGLIKTFNDAPNVAMLAMNEALGFRRTATLYRYELHLGEGA
ncbi:GNAT family N-acetyltransferase [Deinococcus sp. SDU3-2]|uniref:GNAT family N-acetyltransferase n=2 Tax=Deinococcus terrestris TaxID=2651870 RepID=A0A7X1TSV6_9DEIO|nr:GNAT family N-acetyltransferase [Deinococcus terrestris]